MLSPDSSRRPTMLEFQGFFGKIRHDQAAAESATPELPAVGRPPAVPRALTADIGAIARVPPVRAPERAPGGSDGGGSLAPVLAPAAVGGAGGAGHKL